MRWLLWRQENQEAISVVHSANEYRNRAIGIIPDFMEI